jgi:hypothetical protein
MPWNEEWVEGVLVNADRRAYAKVYIYIISYIIISLIYIYFNIYWGGENKECRVKVGECNRILVCRDVMKEKEPNRPEDRINAYYRRYILYQWRTLTGSYTDRIKTVNSTRELVAYSVMIFWHHVRAFARTTTWLWDYLVYSIRINITPLPKGARIPTTLLTCFIKSI